jgi:hypothetical protein
MRRIDTIVIGGRQVGLAVSGHPHDARSAREVVDR